MKQTLLGTFFYGKTRKFFIQTSFYQSVSIVLGCVNFDDLAPAWADCRNSKILLGFVISYFLWVRPSLRKSKHIQQKTGWLEGENLSSRTFYDQGTYITFLLPKYLVNALLRIANRLHALPSVQRRCLTSLSKMRARFCCSKTTYIVGWLYNIAKVHKFWQQTMFGLLCHCITAIFQAVFFS